MRLGARLAYGAQHHTVRELRQRRERGSSVAFGLVSPPHEHKPCATTEPPAWRARCRAGNLAAQVTCSHPPGAQVASLHLLAVLLLLSADRLSAWVLHAALHADCTCGLRTCAALVLLSALLIATPDHLDPTPPTQTRPTHAHAGLKRQRPRACGQKCAVSDDPPPD